MGKPMAKNLLRAGFHLIVHNRSRQPVEELAQAGAEKTSSPAEITDRSEIVITMLPDSSDVELVVLGKKGMIEKASPGKILIDMSSIEPIVSQKIAGQLAEKGMEMLDAPVSGGETGAIRSELAIMVGGKENVFRKCLPLFKVLGKSIVRVGEIGAGGYAKLANQIIVALNMAAVSEAFVLAQKANIQPEKLFQAIRGGLAGSKMMDAKIPLAIERNFKPGFKIQLHRKDVQNALKTAKNLNVPLPLTGIMDQIFSALIADGKEDDDHGGIIQFFEKLAHVEVRK
ncbi:MAG: 2-hydroxy-3-oxopropionate reductase [Calditrichaeota bacterium]|nr:2-hydroxy-3-oxopropionate reductase [Calditrichota bacterium]